MSVGTLVTVKSGIVVKRDPIWPFPKREEYPRQNSDGSITYFEPVPYYNFPIREPYHASLP